MAEHAEPLQGHELAAANRYAADRFLCWLESLTHDPQERILAIIDRYQRSPRGCPEKTIRLLCKGIRVTHVLRVLRDSDYIRYKVYGLDGSSRKLTYWRLA